MKTEKKYLVVINDKIIAKTNSFKKAKKVFNENSTESNENQKILNMEDITARLCKKYNIKK